VCTTFIQLDLNEQGHLQRRAATCTNFILFTRLVFTCSWDNRHSLLVWTSVEFRKNGAVGDTRNFFNTAVIAVAVWVHFQGIRIGVKSIVFF
jgi:hypothetical protein